MYENLEGQYITENKVGKENQCFPISEERRNKTAERNVKVNKAFGKTKTTLIPPVQQSPIV